MAEEGRIHAVQDLVGLRSALPEAIARLKQFPWDSEADLVILTRADARRVLNEYLAGIMSADSVEEWANAVEGRDDIGFEKSHEALLKGLVFELATPQLSHPITAPRAHQWMRQLA